jgi:hypothetical protein
VVLHLLLQAMFFLFTRQTSCTLLGQALAHSWSSVLQIIASNSCNELHDDLPCACNHKGQLTCASNCNLSKALLHV